MTDEICPECHGNGECKHSMEQMPCRFCEGTGITQKGHKMSKLVTDTTGRVWTECEGFDDIHHLTILHRNKVCPLCAELVGKEKEK